MKRFYYLILVLTWSGISLAQPGSLDQTFGQGGKVVTDIGQIDNVPISALIQPDGKIVVFGYSTPAQLESSAIIARYNSDGTLDNSFGVNGIVETRFSPSNEDAVASGVQQPDGKIVVGGYTWTGTDYDFGLLRLNSDGSRDLTFGSSGIVTTDFNGQSDRGNHLLLQSDGKIILAGFTQDPSVYDVDMALARYLPSGILDDSFGNNGRVTVSIGDLGHWQAIRCLALQQDGKIVAAGYTDYYDQALQSLNKVFALLRFNSNGDFDLGFGNNGIVKSAIGKDDVATSVVVQPDNKILLLGTSKAIKGAFPDFALARYNSNGSKDIGFGNDGVVLTSFDNTDDEGNSLVLQSDGKIIAAGFTARNNGSTVDFAMVRYNLNGSLDNTFGTEGKVITDVSGTRDFGTGVALQQNGKIIVVGFVRVGTDYNFALTRYNNDAALPVTLAAFEVKRQENHVLLNWKTTSEENSERFEVQRSTDGKKWVTIASIQASTSSQTEQEYELLDSKPNAGKNLYRLKMIDLDGSFSYSRIRSVSMGEEDLVQVHPNPTSGTLKIQIVNKAEIVNSELLDSQGRSVYSSKEFTENIDLTNVSNGVYSLILSFSDGSRHSKKVLVAK